MRKSPFFITLFALFLAMVLFAFSNSFDKSKRRLNLKGKWFHTYGGNYSKTTKREDLGRWYKFEKKSKISYSTCTDWCGCMRVTNIGKYKWENDSTISVIYNKAKGRNSSYKLDKKQTEKLRVFRVNKNTLSISKIELTKED